MARNLYAKKLRIKEMLKVIIERKIKEEYEDNLKAGFHVFKRQVPRRALVKQRQPSFYRGHQGMKNSHSNTKMN